MPDAVYVLWLILLIIAVLIIPYLAYLLNKAWKMAHSIDIYLKEILNEGTLIANNTGKIKILNDTINVTKDMPNLADKINNHTGKIETVLADRVEKSKKV